MQRVKARFLFFKRVYCDLGGPAAPNPPGNEAAQEKSILLKGDLVSKECLLLREDPQKLPKERRK
jgi:hypothetical protein